MKIIVTFYGLSGTAQAEADTAEDIIDTHRRLKPLLRELRKPLPANTLGQTTPAPVDVGNVVG